MSDSSTRIVPSSRAATTTSLWVTGVASPPKGTEPRSRDEQKKDKGLVDTTSPLSPLSSEA